jgi:outer membrane protein OmpA-like peptidoglycan-associated protein
MEAEQFFYKHKTGDKYRIISTVHEEVYQNRRLTHRSEILNRIAAEIQDIQGGVAAHTAVFQTAERAVGVNGEHSFQWEREYQSAFGRDKWGLLTIDTQYFMPVVRNVPVFPDRDLNPGDTWSAEGHEMHDFREGFGIPDPYRIPFTANYTFLGNREWKEQTYPTFSVSYRIFTEPDTISGTRYPVRIMGASDQVVYWDAGLGQPAAYQEQFRMVFELSDGRTLEYRGRAEAETIESTTMDKEKIAQDIADDIARLGIEDVSVRVTDDGIVLNLENIQFHPDSAVWLPGEEQKLDTIAEILMHYQERDILVGGHTALAGSANSRMQLSQQRASVVADYLIEKKVRTVDRILVRGYGAEKPLGDNRNETGRQQNRRVEITILEN